MYRANKKGTMKDYYSILGINPTASEDEIKKAYRSLAMKHHPDRGGDQERFQEIQEAYSVLTDPQKKAEWEAQKHGHRFHPGNDGFNFNFNFGGSPFDIHDIFTNFHGGGNPFHGFAQRQRRNKDLKVVIDLDLASTLQPQVKNISVKHVNGSRHDVQIEIPRGVNGSVQMKCAGHGDRSHPDLPPGDLYVHFRVHENPEFNIEGLDLIKVIKVNCLDAMIGENIIVTGLDNKKFDVTIPPGIQNGMRFRIPQEGLYAVDHPVRGNLLVQVELKIPTDLTEEQLLMITKIANEYKLKSKVNS